jgi:glycine/D-amino acid oxidase-like deaminating enzyme
MRVAIIGAGIMGLTAAFSIKESFKNSIITVYANEFSPYTTSDVSAGYWEPFCINDENQDEQRRVLYKIIFLLHIYFFELFHQYL